MDGRMAQIRYWPWDSRMCTGNNIKSNGTPPPLVHTLYLWLKFNTTLPSFPNRFHSFARRIPMILSFQGSWDTTEISVEPIRFLEPLKLRGSEITYFLVNLKVNRWAFLLSCLFKFTFNASQSACLTLCSSLYTVCLCSDVQLKLCCSPLSTLSTTDNVLCVNCGAQSRPGRARREGSSRNVQTRLLFSTLTFAEF